MTSAEQGDIASEIAQMREQLARLFAAHGADAALQQLPPARAVVDDGAKIVVVGEVGAGKTAFVNAILDRPDPLPTEPTKTTVAVDAGGPDELAGMTLFDTPGVGGLDATTAQATLSALDQATALVFVCSVESKISIAERDFLAEAARRVDHIVFVGSKVDLLPDLGAANLREDEQTVAGSSRFPSKRFADPTFLPFSARIAGDARDRAGDSARMLAASGVPAVRERLNQIAARQAVYSQLNAMRAMKEAITLAHHDLHRRKQAIDQPAAKDELDRLTDQLTQLRESTTTWRRTLSKRLEDAQDDARDAHKRRIKAIRADYEQRLARREKAQIQDLETDLVSALCQAQTDANADLRGAVAEIARDLWRRIFDSDPDIADLADRLPTPSESPADYIAARTKATRDAADTLAGVQQGYIGTMMWQNLTRAVEATGLIAANAASAVASMGAAAPFGVAWFLLQKRLGDRRADLAGLSSWATAAINEASAEISGEIDRGFRKASWLLQEAVEEAITDAIEATQSAKRAQADAIRDLNAEIQQIDKLREELAAPTKQWNLLHDALLAVAEAPLDTQRRLAR
ncbi:GTPase [Mycobacterium sp. 1245805.9]|uniref:GTPase n=1 Tax=Mycobacterium sp. 1245805.9 TaxID=1856862 RepID=UPI0018D39BBF|nr:GTPase [Mycobacterium sp. 1245805.9]